MGSDLLWGIFFKCDDGILNWKGILHISPSELLRSVQIIYRRNMQARGHKEESGLA